MFSKTCNYAIRALMFISRQSEKKLKVGIREIAKETSAPEYFIGKILQDLVQKKLVQSVKGPNGGFYLNEVSKKITVAEVVCAVDGTAIFKSCGMGLKNCSEKRPCPLHDQFKQIREQLFMVLDSVKLGEFNAELENGRLFLKR